MKTPIILNNEKGLATIEVLPILVLFVILSGYSFGMYGIIQTAILHSISARAYAFETFRNRANVTYFRSNTVPTPYQSRFNKIGSRLHTVTTELPNPGSIQIASERSLAMGLSPSRNPQSETGNNAQVLHNQTLPAQFEPNRYKIGASPVWVRIGYGICVTAKCEPN